MSIVAVAYNKKRSKIRCAYDSKLHAGNYIWGDDTAPKAVIVNREWLIGNVGIVIDMLAFPDFFSRFLRQKNKWFDPKNELHWMRLLKIYNDWLHKHFLVDRSQMSESKMIVASKHCGIVELVSNGFATTFTEQGFHAIGAGDDAAIGALLVGAKPAKAVKAAIDQGNVKCQPPINKLKLKL